MEYLRIQNLNDQTVELAKHKEIICDKTPSYFSHHEQVAQNSHNKN